MTTRDSTPDTDPPTLRSRQDAPTMPPPSLEEGWVRLPADARLLVLRGDARPWAWPDWSPKR